MLSSFDFDKTKKKIFYQDISTRKKNCKKSIFSLPVFHIVHFLNMDSAILRVDSKDIAVIPRHNTVCYRLVVHSIWVHCHHSNNSDVMVGGQEDSSFISVVGKPWRCIVDISDSDSDRDRRYC